ncbi:type IV toxin-antitoxin system AbiEi family antitoxin domain-containing protein [Streptomyces sp. NPDC017248]|uniref:type IV toxin-antitoxin system AbiEi family antitoxin domain-containing protein n=1 Tax=unclassified Streptomyces TaxID=2593676 RepID=UPI0037AEE04F
MAHQSFLLNSARHMRSLVTHDETAVQAAQKHLHEAQASLEDSMLRAKASREALESVELRLSKVVGLPQGDQDVLFPPPSTGSEESTRTNNAPVVDLIRNFLRQREEATTREIIEHIRLTRPTTSSANVSPELSRLMKKGDLLRPRHGVYSLAQPKAPQGGGA